MIGGNKHINTITGKAVYGGASIMLTRTARKIQLDVSAGHTNIVEVNTSVVLGTTQYAIEAIVLKAVERGVERVLPNRNVPIDSSIEHAKCRIEIGSE